MTIRRTLVTSYPSLKSASEDYLGFCRTHVTSLKTIRGIVNRMRRLYPDTKAIRIEKYDGYQLISSTEIIIGDNV